MKGACCGSWLFFHVFNVCVGLAKASDIPALMSGGRTGEVVAWRPLRRTLHSGVWMAGNTVLYIPMEALQRSPGEASKDKELIQRLEIVLIHWTRQFNEVLGAQHLVEMGDSAGPLEEITFWSSRCADLTGISLQLQKPGVRHIQSILRLSKSSYLQPFSKLAQEIQDGSQQAESNLRFLSLLKQPCEELVQLQPGQVAPKLQHIADLIRIIWDNSPHYNTRDRLTALFHKMSNEMIRLCCRSLSLDRLFQGHVASSKQNLRDCIECCMAWKHIYLQAARIHHRSVVPRRRVNFSDISPADEAEEMLTEFMKGKV
ncbi:unnamed protein product [Boreogadus saida]